jgi:hypothetical protein
MSYYFEGEYNNLSNINKKCKESAIFMRLALNEVYYNTIPYEIISKIQLTMYNTYQFHITELEYFSTANVIDKFPDDSEGNYSISSTEEYTSYLQCPLNNCCYNDIEYKESSNTDRRVLRLVDTNLCFILGHDNKIYLIAIANDRTEKEIKEIECKCNYYFDHDKWCFCLYDNPIDDDQHECMKRFNKNCYFIDDWQHKLELIHQMVNIYSDSGPTITWCCHNDEDFKNDYDNTIDLLQKQAELILNKNWVNLIKI